MTVVVDSFVEDSSLLDCCDLVAFFVCLFFHLMLAYFEATVCGFWGGFNCFFSFIWCQLFACLIRAALFCLPPAFVVWYFFATGICGLFFLSLPQAFVYNLFLSWPFLPLAFVLVCLCLVSACFRVSVYLSVSGIMLCACCSSTSSLENRAGIFSKSVTLWTALQIPLWSKPHLVFRHKVYEIALSKVLATQMGVTEAHQQSQLVWIVQIWPNFASQRVDSAGTRA